MKRVAATVTAMPLRWMARPRARAIERMEMVRKPRGAAILVQKAKVHFEGSWPRGGGARSCFVGTESESGRKSRDRVRSSARGMLKSIDSKVRAVEEELSAWEVMNPVP